MPDQKKMIYVGSLATDPDRDSGWMREFAKLGWSVLRLDTNIEVSGGQLIKRIKRRFQCSSEYRALERQLLKMADLERPSWVHFRMPMEFSRKTILELKKRDIVVTQYCPDDIFSKKSPVFLHRKLRRAVDAFDGHFVFRLRNVSDYSGAGAKHVEHCPPTYDAEIHTLAQRNPDGSFIADAAFIGHYENDGRLDYMEALYEAGFKVILKGGMWDAVIKGKKIGALAPVHHAFGAEYNHIYANVVAGICFFSKINNDEWTRRALEIVAVGGLLVCERTREAQSRFIDKEEAFFFSSPGELVEIVADLVKNTEKRNLAQAAGYRRLIKDGNALANRAVQIDSFVNKVLT